jgi:hypothetical protein
LTGDLRATDRNLLQGIWKETDHYKYINVSVKIILKWVIEKLEWSGELL